MPTSITLSVNKKGFTLVELLVVITIIAILATIGLTIYTSAQKQARDAKRRSDIDAIAQTMEINYSRSTFQYTQLADTMFPSGKIPRDPLADPNNNYVGPRSCLGNNECYYCSRTSDQTYGNCTGSDDRIPTQTPFSGSPGKFVICANLETGNQTYYCRSNQR
ncbi:prepilin-type N-terminal cleavage/methylation domain-containing protein [Candidatus Daviesbacteria bacterium]|nr:prepilin-type N-terminal cleavage/methylation domain-containing protein [Candidatus Daviesbacteria bacterium]